MKIINLETALREETRTIEQSRPGIERKSFVASADSLVDTQEDLADRTAAVVEMITDLPDGAKKFGRQISLINAAAGAMWDAADILAQPNTGPEANAAETEAIEILLQSKRAKPKAGSGPSPTGADQSGSDGGAAALALLGDSDEDASQVVDKHVDQSTGRTESEHPEEFRDGLDRYFELLEKGIQ